MGKLKILSGKAVCAILARHGFEQVRQRGSHVVMQRRTDEGTTTVPVPDHKELRAGTILSIIRQSGVFVEIKDGSTVMPLYVYPVDNEAQGDLLVAKEKQPNLAPEFIEALSERLGLPFDPAAHRGIHTRSSSASSASPAVKSSWTTSQESEVERPQGGSETRGTRRMSRVNPEDLFCYTYAVFHSPTYRERYAEFLKIDFPRLPLTSDVKLFFKLADLGEELVRLHLMRSLKLNDFITGFPHSGSNEVENLRYEDGNVWFNKDQCFSGVEAADWNFHIGGYQVLNKWLKDRKGRTLSFDGIEHCQKIIVAIHETRCLMDCPEKHSAMMAS